MTRWLNSFIPFTLPRAAMGAGIWFAGLIVLRVAAQPIPQRPPHDADPSRVPAGVELRRPSDPAPSERLEASAAATAAVDNLRDEIGREPLTSRMTVGEFLHRAGGTDALVRELAHADPIGGPRWLDLQTCQVQLEISGSRVARVLAQVAASSKTSPLPPSEVDRLTLDWRRRTFSATGSSTDFAHVAAARPRGSNVAWLPVPETERLRALVSARDDAFAHVLSSVRLIPLGRTATVADVLANPGVHAAVSDWLSRLPVTRVNYRSDLQVELTFAITPDGLYDALRDAAEKHRSPNLLVTEADWSRVRRDMIGRMEPATGRGTASPDNGPRLPPGPANVVPPLPAPPEIVPIPLGMPRWANEQIGATALAEAAPSKLKAARAAETAARRRLAEQVETLPLTRTLTLGAAAARDPRIRDAIGRAVDRGRVEKTDYSHGSQVQVDMRLELRDVWDQLRALR